MKKIPWTLFAILIIIIAYALNLVDASIGGYAKIFNVAVTVGYVVFWIAFLIFNMDNPKRISLSVIISGITFVCAVLITIVNFTDFTIKYWDTVYMLTLLATPFYGVRFFVHNMSWCMVAISMLTGIWFICGLILNRKAKTACKLS